MAARCCSTGATPFLAMPTRCQPAERAVLAMAGVGDPLAAQRMPSEVRVGRAVARATGTGRRQMSFSVTMCRARRARSGAKAARRGRASMAMSRSRATPSSRAVRRIRFVVTSRAQRAIDRGHRHFVVVAHPCVRRVEEMAERGRIRRSGGHCGSGRSASEVASKVQAAYAVVAGRRATILVPAPGDMS